MSMELLPKSAKANGGKMYCFSMSAWRQLLELALRGGWVPAGTLLPEKDNRQIPIDNGRWNVNWGGHYCSNDAQFVTAEDAANLTIALERILPDMPDHNVILHFIGFARNSDGFWIY